MGGIPDGGGINDPGTSGTDAACSCRMVAENDNDRAMIGLALGALAIVARRRRR